MITPPNHTLKHLTAAWQAQLRAAADKPWLFALLMRQWARLFRRFAHFYQRLLALPRPHKRALKRTLTTTLAGAALMLALGQALPAQAASITVDGVTCTLAEAIDSANNDNAAGNGCVHGSGADILDLQTDVTLSALLPQITSAITLEGNGHTLDGNNTYQVLNVQASGNLTLNDVTISGGHDGYAGGGISNRGTLTVNDGTISGNTSDTVGGGIANFYGTVMVNNSTISGNTATTSVIGGGGGGIFNSGTLTVNNSILSGNSAYDGGGINNFFGTVTVNNSFLNGNIASLQGGGGIKNQGALTVNNSTLSGNSAKNYGGGISTISNSISVMVNNSTLTENSAQYGGGIFSSDFGTVEVNNSTLTDNSAYDGGGIFNGYGTKVQMTVNNSTISGNLADRFGGGIFNRTTLTANNSTLTGNDAPYGSGIYNYNASEMSLNRSLISGNSYGLSGAEVFNRGTIIANNYNVVGYGGNARSYNFTLGASDIIPPGVLNTVLNPMLVNNGGPTLTHALVSDSVAIDAVPDGDCSAPPINGVDQRGFARNVDGNGNPSGNDCDAGAFEYTPAMPIPDQKIYLPLIVRQDNVSAVTAPAQAAYSLINFALVTLLTLGNLPFFRKGHT